MTGCQGELYSPCAILIAPCGCKEGLYEIFPTPHYHPPLAKDLIHKIIFKKVDSLCLALPLARFLNGKGDVGSEAT